MFLCIISHHLNYNNKISQSLILKHEPCLQKQLWSADQILIGQKIDLAVKEEKGKVLICNLGPTFAIWGSALLFAININKTQTSLSKNSLAFSTFPILFEHFGLVWIPRSWFSPYGMLTTKYHILTRGPIRCWHEDKIEENLWQKGNK